MTASAERIPQRRASDFCPACDKPWDECKCPRLVQLNGGVVTK